MARPHRLAAFAHAALAACVLAALATRIRSGAGGGSGRHRRCSPQHHDVQHRVRRHGRRSRQDPRVRCAVPTPTWSRSTSPTARSPGSDASRATTTSAAASTWSRATRSSTRPAPAGATCSCSSRPGRSSPSRNVHLASSDYGPRRAARRLEPPRRCSAPSGACAFPICDRSCGRRPDSPAPASRPSSSATSTRPRTRTGPSRGGAPAAGALPRRRGPSPTARAQGVHRLVARRAPRPVADEGLTWPAGRPRSDIELEPAPRRARKTA